MQSQRNKQCSSWEEVPENYEKLLQGGAAREVARCCLPILCRESNE